MKKGKSLKGEVVDSYLHRFPTVASKTLARKIALENPALFTLDRAYSSIRTMRGANGEKNRKDVKNTAHYIPHRKPNEIMHMPKGKVAMPDWKPLQIGKCKALVLSDIHTPFHDEAALQAALEEGKKHKIDTIILNGDFMDFHAASSFRKDPRDIDFKEEIDTGVALLTYIRKQFPKARIIFKEGNHDERWEHYLMEKAPILLDIAAFTLPSFLQFDKLRIEHVKDKRPIRLGKLNVLHGHEYRFIFSPVNVARGLFLRANAHALCGHMHKNSHHSEPNLEGKSISTWSNGCLCDVRPKYDPLAKWQHGASIVEVLKDNETFHVHQFKIINGKVY